MEFTEIRLVNFGLYSGEHVLDLRPPARDDAATARPIVLIGGKNGAGKTTILEAVRLCLYGAASRSGARRPEYESYLLGRIHRQHGSPLQNQFASVGVSFTHTGAGASQRFDVRRVWQRRRRDGVDETLEVRRDGVPLAADEYGWWQQFLHDLLPPGLASLFFFDGEQIQALADDPDYSALGAAIRSLLGLDLLDRLRGDLAVYVARQRRSGDDGLEQQLATLAAERTALEEQFEDAFFALTTSERELAHLRGKVEEQERALVSEGGTLAAQRDTLHGRVAELQAALQHDERALAEHAAGLLPFSLIPELCRSLRERLLAEEQSEHQRATHRAAAALGDELLARLTRDDAWLGGAQLHPEVRAQVMGGLTNTLQAVSAAVAGDAPTNDAPPIHDLSRGERGQILGWLDAAATLPPVLHALATASEATAHELDHVEAQLQQIPSDAVIQPIMERLAALQREWGALEAQHRQYAAAVQAVRARREALQRREHELYARVMRGDDPESRLRLAGRARKALAKYEAALQRAKLQTLEQKIVECFGRLSRKGGYIREVRIDPRSFETQLLNGRGDALPQAQLSAGEKQIYAVAVLWALRIVSGRSLPIIVDTPLGRLDSEHRQRLVERYFPHASHQVVLLSTDTEIDAELFAALQPAIARSYQLQYANADHSAHIAEGSFWDEPVSAQEVTA